MAASKPEIKQEKMLLNVSEVAKMLGISRSQTYILIADGTLPSCNIKKSVRVPADRLKQWIEQSTSGGQKGENLD